MSISKSYWVPNTKWELVTWLSTYYHKSKSYFDKMRKKQLYAIYYNTRERRK